MNTPEIAMQRYHDSLTGIQPSLTGAELPWLAGKRRSALEDLTRLGLPQRRQESWRYTSIDKLLGYELMPVTEAMASLQESDIRHLWLPDLQTHRILFVNGRFVPQLSDLSGLPAGITVGSLRDLIRCNPIMPARWLGHASGASRHAFGAMNSAAIHDGLVIDLPRNQRLERPVEVLQISMGRDDAILYQPRNLVVLEAGSEATLIERHVCLGNSHYFHNGMSEILVQEGARLEHLRIQEESPAASFLHGIFARQAADSRYEYSGFSLGGAWARTELNLDLQGEGAHARLDGLYTTGSNQLTDYHLNIRHTVPGCRSDTRFKGLLHGRGRAVFDGSIVVEKEAQKTEAHLNNANLLLSRRAEVDTKPQLEIHADDVRCSHGATVGQLEPIQLFYLRSRGIDALDAQRMLCMGFAGEILEQCRIRPVSDIVGRAIENELNALAPEVAGASSD